MKIELFKGECTHFVHSEEQLARFKAAGWTEKVEKKQVEEQEKAPEKPKKKK